MRLHEAADGFVARVRIPGGQVSPAQLLALADLAESLGDGHLYLTSRGNVQLRGLRSSCGQQVADALYAAGLLPSVTHDRVRNVVASPLGGLTGHPATGEVLEDFDQALLDDDGLVALSGRFLFGIDNGTGDVLALAPDVAVVLPADGSVAGWESGTDLARLAVGGQLTAVTAPIDLAADLMIGAAHRFLALRAAHAPNAWRVTELPADALAELAPGRPGPVLAPADHPTGEPLATAKAAQALFPPPAKAGTRCLVRDYDGGLGLVWSDYALRAIVAGVPLGSAPASAWRAIAHAFDDSGCTLDEVGFTFTPWRSVVLYDPHVGHEEVLREHGFLLDDADPLAQVTACIGQPGCAKALADVRADAPTLAAAHPGVRLHLAGCERRCGHPTSSHLSAVADPASDTGPDHQTNYSLEQH